MHTLSRSRWRNRGEELGGTTANQLTYIRACLSPSCKAKRACKQTNISAIKKDKSHTVERKRRQREKGRGSKAFGCVACLFMHFGHRHNLGHMILYLMCESPQYPCDGVVATMFV